MQLRDAIDVENGVLSPIRIAQHYAVITCVMSNIHMLRLRQADPARTDFGYRAACLRRTRYRIQPSMADDCRRQG
jgi:hypothetical protein